MAAATLPSLTCFLLASVVRKVDNAIHQINHHQVDSTVCFVYSVFEQPGPDQQEESAQSFHLRPCDFPRTIVNRF